MTTFRGKTVLITGASSGIGAAVARELARRGANLALAARRLDRLEDLQRELESMGVQALPLVCNVTHDGDAENAIAQAKERFGHVDVVIANAGYSVVGRVDELPLDVYRKQFETNVFGVLRTVKAAVPELKRVRGSLALIGSVAGHVSLSHASPYSMSKFAVRALADSLHGELRADGVSVTLISPGFVASEIRQVDNTGTRHPEAKEPIPPWLLMPAPKAARKIVNAIAQRKREAVITFHGKVIVFLKNHFSPLIGAVTVRSRTRQEAGKTIAAK